jgi:hypothetical protein
VKRKLACGSLAISALVAFAIFAGFGCGTMANMAGREQPLMSLPGQVPTKPFGGVGRDLKWIASGNIFLIPDIPFSLVGDVVTLPKVLRGSRNSLPLTIVNGPKPEVQNGGGQMVLDLDEEKMRTEALKYVPIGTPMTEAKCTMEMNGFKCQEEEARKLFLPEIDTGSCLVCSIDYPKENSDHEGVVSDQIKVFIAIEKGQVKKVLVRHERSCL